MNRKAFAAILCAVLVLGGAAWVGWTYLSDKSERMCGACARPVHGHSRTVALAEGKRSSYCCPACALSEHRQTGKPVQVVEVTDYNSGGTLDPAQSYFVRDSDVNPCREHSAALDPDKHRMHAQFDRCAPSYLAFREEKAARAFTAQHGGRIMRFAELAAHFQH